MIKVQIDQDAIWGDYEAPEADRERSEQTLFQQVRDALQVAWPDECVRVSKGDGYSIDATEITDEAIADVVQAVWQSWSWVVPSVEPTCAGCACFRYMIPPTMYRRGVHRAGEHGVCCSAGVPRHIESNRSVRCAYWLHRE